MNDRHYCWQSNYIPIAATKVTPADNRVGVAKADIEQSRAARNANPNTADMHYILWQISK